VLAYLLWHAQRGDDAAGYCAGLAAFHDALATDPPRGFIRSWTVRVPPVDWLPSADTHYLDWYLVDDFTALGLLNEAAVSGSRRVPHDAVAGMARTGTAGVIGLLGREATVPDPPSAAVVAMVDKPSGASYGDFTAALLDAAPEMSCWMRQMTLGPGPEFLVLGGVGAPELPWPTLRLPAVTIAA
jgi:hypothetical protein